MAQYQLAGILDTRPAGSKHGIKHKCGLCPKSSQIWVCLEEINFVPEMKDRFRSVKAVGKLVVGTCCCKKLVKTGMFPIFTEQQVMAALEHSPISITSRKGRKLFEEFKG